jgi:hypothetical protein
LRSSAVRSAGLTSRAVRFACGLAVGCTSIVSDPRSLSAQPVPEREESRAFEYTTRWEKHYFRPIVEEFALLGLGLAQYFIQRDANSIDWDLDYDWPSFRAKLVGDAYAFDTNKFDTNFVTHPAGGWAYYVAARGNRLNVLESLGYTFASSTVWEFLAEFREQVSVNDFFVTPLAGFALGESTTQLGAFFDRSCPSFGTKLLGTLLGPSKTAHDAVDGLTPLRDRTCDARGLSTRGGHRFRLWSGAATVWSDAYDAASSEMRVGLNTAVTHLDSLGAPGRGWTGFSDGNVASLDVTTAIGAGRLTDFRIAARTVPAGVHYRNLRSKRAGSSGSEALLGVLVGTEYSQHRYRRPAGKLDRVFVLDVPAATLQYIHHRGSHGLEFGLDAGGALAGVDSFALREYLELHSDDELASTTRLRGYSHAFGFSLAPRVRIRLNGAEFGLDGRADRFYGLRVLDRLRSSPARVPVSDVRRRGTLWVSVGSSSDIPRFTLFFDTAQRSGRVAEIERRVTEASVGASLDAVF